MSIATELTRLNTNKEALATAKTAIASAITDKGGTVASGDGFADFATDIARIPSVGGIDTSVNDNQIKLLIMITPDNADCYLQYVQSVANGVEVDFGDGSQAETSDIIGGSWSKCAYLHHEYTKFGPTVVTFTANSGSVKIGDNVFTGEPHVYSKDYPNNTFGKNVIGVYFGNGITYKMSDDFESVTPNVIYNWNGEFGLTSNGSLTSLTIMEGATKASQVIADYLTHVKVPNTIRTFGTNSFRSIKEMRLFDMTEWSKSDVESCTFGSGMFTNPNTNLQILFSTEEAMNAAKVATNFSHVASYMHYVGEEETA